MAFDALFAGLATAFSETFGGPYHAAVAHRPGTPITDDGGSIVTPGTPTQADCRAQGGPATERMRADAGFLEKDIALLILGLTALDTSAEIEIEAGPHAGRWALQTATRDPVGIGWECRARPC